MSLTRRGFLGLLTTAAAGVAISPELAELLKPRPTIFLPPRGGWVPPLLTIEMIKREALRVLHQNIKFHPDAFQFIIGEQWTTEEMLTARAPKFQGWSFNRIMAKV